MKIIFQFTLFLWIFVFQMPAFAGENGTNFQKILSEFKNADSPQILVVAHRGMWREAPENSLAGIRAAILAGVDMVEVDVRKTSDGEIILMHDESIERTTNGSGRVDELSFAQCRQFYLRDSKGNLTSEKIPLLKDALKLVKHHIMLNLDMSFEIMADILPLLKATGTLEHVLFKGHAPPVLSAQKLAQLSEPVFYMPIFYNMQSQKNDASLQNETSDIQASIQLTRPVAAELVFDHTDNPLIGNSAIQIFKKNHIQIWINTLADRLCAGHGDQLSLKNPAAGWGWCIKRGAGILQTDYPRQLLQYLIARNLHWEPQISAPIK